MSVQVCSECDRTTEPNEVTCAECEALANPQGFFDDIPEAEYHAHESSISHSGLKVILDHSPAEYLWRQNHPTTSDAFDLGSAAHKLVLGVGATIEPINADSWRTKDAQEKRDAARLAGSIPLLNKDYAVVQAMADKLSEHDLAMKLLSDGKPEVSAFAIDEPTGVMRRCRYDWLGSGYAVDYKSTVDERPKSWAGRYGTAAKFGYDTQAAFYTDIARDLGKPLDAFVFVTQRKTAPYPVSVVELTADSLQRARERIRLGLDIYADCTKSGVWPGSQMPGTYHLIDTDDQHPIEVLL